MTSVLDWKKTGPELLGFKVRKLNYRLHTQDGLDQ